MFRNINNKILSQLPVTIIRLPSNEKKIYVKPIKWIRFICLLSYPEKKQSECAEYVLRFFYQRTITIFFRKRIKKSMYILLLIMI